MKIYVGDIDTFSDPAYLKEIMKERVQTIENESIKEYKANGYSEKYRKLVKDKGCTRKEYVALFNKKIPPSDYYDLKASEFAGLRDQDDKSELLINFSKKNEDDYGRFLQTYGSDELSFFLREDKALKKRLSAKTITTKHTYASGSTGSGKSTFMITILAQLIEWMYPVRGKRKRTNFIIVDPHGPFAEYVMRLKCVQEHIEDMIYLYPGMRKGMCPTINMFDQPVSDIDELSYHVDQMMVAFEASLHDQTLTGPMEGYLRPCLNVMFWYKDMTLMDLHTLLRGIYRKLTNNKNHEFNEEEVELMRKGRGVPEMMTVDFFTIGYLEADSRSIKALLQRITHILGHPAARNFVVGKSTLDIKEAINGGKNIVINISGLGDYGGALIGRMILAYIQNVAAKRRDIESEYRWQTVMMVDECQTIVSKYIERALSEFRKYKFSLFLAHQYTEQLDVKLLKSMMSNCRNKIVGANSGSNAGVMDSEMGVHMDKIIRTPFFHFWVKDDYTTEQNIKHGKKELATLVKAPKTYVWDSSAGNKYYLSKDEYIKQVEEYMIKMDYYRPIVEQAEIQQKYRDIVMEDDMDDFDEAAL